MSHVRPVLFDMDGTLIDSADVVTRCFDETMREEAGIVHERRYYEQFLGPPLRDSFARLGAEDPEHFVASYRARYVRIMLQTPLFDGIDELLARLQAGGVPMAVATSKKEAAARAIAEHLDIAKYFLAVCGADEDGGKVAKHQVIADALAVFDRAGVDASRAVMVGDRKYDVEGADVHGLPTILVRWGPATEDEYALAVATAATPGELGDILLAG
ncbi:MAG: HAD hydrolase-like protein [Actinomycetaceae bacterium]|nr:HAD hydrolase-like protein [Actinomycetaceae bacterium]